MLFPNYSKPYVEIKHKNKKTRKASKKTCPKNSKMVAWRQILREVMQNPTVREVAAAALRRASGGASARLQASAAASSSTAARAGSRAVVTPSPSATSLGGASAAAAVAELFADPLARRTAAWGSQSHVVHQRDTQQGAVFRDPLARLETKDKDL